ncbi:hypothetical protein [Cellulomonas sp. URHE0023]|uniref:rhamnosyltransferase WsaF family glycosyltransferase n=1 Tax=Cellulomonas sp. URHE0023 TaxID=1380354 RepID=UPI001E3A54EE|nr:hypothetical protein [Cellulomonas sp. URHE0023]
MPEPVDDVQLVFDSAFYRETYADIVEAGLEPFNHFRDHGRAEGRQPSALFDPTFYLEQNEDVAAAGIDPLAHFLTSGGAEGRDPIRAGFSSGWYLDRHPDVASAGINPLVHWLTDGVELGYDPCSNFDTSWYLTHNADVAGAGINPLAHYLRHGVGEGRRPNGRGTTLTGSTGNDAEMPTNVSTLLSRRNPDLRVFRTIPGPAVPRINLVTDSIGADSLFGGVATAVIVASAWAEQTGRRLRIVTRHSSPDGAGLDNLFRTIGARPSRQPELAFVPIGPGDYLETGDDDIFLTTSWWTTTSVLRTIPADKVVYILQEDERAFYPTGGDSLAAAAAMNHPGLTVLVNTEGLRQHLMATGIDNLSTTGISFEPSFTPFLRPGRVVGAGGKRNLFFYARPHNPRNLFDVGIAAIDAAIEGGHLPRERWTVHFAGRGVPPIDFCDGSRPVLHDALGWAEYRDLLGRMDLGVSLMASPHPSYPPLDLAASGSVVVTNSWPGKPELIHVSSRLVTAPSTVDGLTEAIAKATVLVESASREPFDPSDAPYFRPWSDNLADVVEHLVRRFGDV